MDALACNIKSAFLSPGLFIDPHLLPCQLRLSMTLITCAEILSAVFELSSTFIFPRTRLPLYQPVYENVATKTLIKPSCSTFDINEDFGSNENGPSTASQISGVSRLGLLSHSYSFDLILPSRSLHQRFLHLTTIAKLHPTFVEVRVRRHGSKSSFRARIGALQLHGDLEHAWAVPVGCAEQCAGCCGRSRVVYFLVTGEQDGRKIDGDRFYATDEPYWLSLRLKMPLIQKQTSGLFLLSLLTAAARCHYRGSKLLFHWTSLHRIRPRPFQIKSHSSGPFFLVVLT